MKVLFILKRREDFDPSKHTKLGLSTGLFNSASFVNDMLNEMGVESNLVVAIDNNEIDREVTLHKPTHVVIEALWVVPEKFAVLQKLHPNVIWIVRLHSELPFMAGEGIAMDWVGEYSSFKNVFVGINAPRMFKDMSIYLKIRNGNADKLISLSNYYPQVYKNPKVLDKTQEVVHIGCFGAVRILKNHLSQAMAALEFANRINKKLVFHINSERQEMSGQPVVRNLLNLFEQIYSSGHRLIQHSWTPRAEFLTLCGQMDIGMQVSFSETFNIVGADFVSQGVPFLGSSEIPWIGSWNRANPTSVGDITDELECAWNAPLFNTSENQRLLLEYTENVKKEWSNYFRKEEI